MSSKFEKLKRLLTEYARVVVAFSGGVDSSFLLKTARDQLGVENTLAITAISASMPAVERQAVAEIARQIGARHILIETHEVEQPLYVRNAPDRCYHCRAIILDQILAYARTHQFSIVIDGNNAEDLGDYRPGQAAARERGIHSPLQVVGFTKAEIRDHAQALGLSNWNKPATPCLASRVPYGSPITSEKLRQIEAAETFLHTLGLGQLRVRHHDQIARLEIESSLFGRALELRPEIIAHLKSLGFHYVTLDLAGFRSGSMNEVLNHGSRKTA